MKFFLTYTARARRLITQFQRKRISAFVGQGRLVLVRIGDSTLRIEILRAHMQGLVNVGDVMGEKNEGNGLGDLAFVLFWSSSSQDFHAVRDHMHDVPFATASCAVAVVLLRHDWHIGVMKPMM